MRVYSFLCACSLMSCTLFSGFCNSYYLADKLTNPGANANSGGSGNSGPSAIYIYRAPSSYTADLGTAGGTVGNGRSGADNLCAAARSGFTFPDNTGSNVRGFTSISSSDSIANMPSNYGIPLNKPIKGPTDNVIQTNWVNLMSGAIMTDLTTAGVMIVSTGWWSFSSGTGSFDATNNCTGGTTTGGLGTGGSSGSVTTTWMGSSAVSCGSSYYLLCVCY